MFRSRSSSRKEIRQPNIPGEAGILPPTKWSPAIGRRGFRPLAAIAPVAAKALAHAAPASLPQFARSGIVTPFSRLRDVFTPSQPKPLGPLFVGRDQYLSRLICAVEEERAHVVLFGERGRGKTSLANAVASLALEAGHLVLRQTCGTGTTFEDLFRTAFGAISLQSIAPACRDGLANAASLLPGGPFGPAAAIDALRKVAAQQTLFIIDEFDRIASLEVRTAITETIKGLSDLQLPVSLLLVGVSGRLEDLIGRHPSVERNILGVHLMRMTSEEIRALVMTGSRAAGLVFTDDVVRAILRCSRGMPYYAHLLCLLAGREAAGRDATRVEDCDFLVAAATVRAKLHQEVSPVLETLETADAHLQAMLLRAAMAACDEHERFDVAAVTAAGEPGAPPLEAAGVETALRRLSTLRPAPLTLHVTARGPLFSFAQPWLAHLLLLRREAGLNPIGVEHAELV